MPLTTRGRIGLSNVYFAILDETTDIIGGSPSFGTPVPLAVAAELSYDPGASQTAYYGDDALRILGETVGNQKVSLKLIDVDPTAAAQMLGTQYANGQLIFGAADSSPFVAIMAKQLMSGKNGSNPVYEYMVLYKCQFTKPKRAMKTKGASIAFQEMQLDGQVAVLNSTNKYLMLQRDDDSGSVAALTNWFTAVQLPSADNTAFTVTAAKGTAGDVGKIIYTFAKASAAGFSLNQALITAANLLVLKLGAVVAGTFAVTTPTGVNPVVKFTPSVAFSASDVVSIACLPAVRDANNIPLTQYTNTFTF